MKYYKIGSRFEIDSEQYLLCQIDGVFQLVNLTTGVKFGEVLNKHNLINSLWMDLLTGGKPFKLIG